MLTAEPSHYVIELKYRQLKNGPKNTIYTLNN